MEIFKKYLTFIFIILLLFSCKTSQRVENLGIFGRNRLKAVAGQDGCTPIHIDRKFTMWTFGDTIFGDWKGEVTVGTTFEESASFRGMISNSMAFTDYPDDEKILDLKFRFLKKNGKIASFIDPGKGMDGTVYRIWAIDGIKINNSVYLYYIIIRILKTKNLVPFSVYGTGLAVWEIPPEWKPGDAVTFRKIGRIFRENEPTFGDSVILKDDYLYMIGHHNIKGKVFAYFARVKPEHIRSRDSYMFLKKNGEWTSDIKDAHGYFGEVFGEPSLSYNRFLGKYIVIYCGSGGEIKTAVFGDFSRLAEVKPKTVYIPEKLPEIKTRVLYMYYSGKEIFYSEKYLYAIYINPAIYQPILLRIPYSALK